MTANGEGLSGTHGDWGEGRGGAHDPSGPVAGALFRWDLGRECR